MDKVKEKADPGVGGICCALLAVPWIIVWYIFMTGSGDPEHCYVTEGELWVSQTPTPGNKLEYDMVRS